MNCSVMGHVHARRQGLGRGDNSKRGEHAACRRAHSTIVHGYSSRMCRAERGAVLAHPPGAWWQAGGMHTVERACGGPPACTLYACRARTCASGSQSAPCSARATAGIVGLQVAARIGMRGQAPR